MTTESGEDRCRECNHERKYHTPIRCTYETETERCPCPRFSPGETVDPESARREVDVLMDKAVLALRRAFSSGVEIEKEMHEAVDRIMGEETKGRNTSS